MSGRKVFIIGIEITKGLAQDLSRQPLKVCGTDLRVYQSFNDHQAGHDLVCQFFRECG